MHDLEKASNLLFTHQLWGNDQPHAHCHMTAQPTKATCASPTFSPKFSALNDQEQGVD